MSLTQRLYKLEEVRAALLYSIKTKNILESAFWLEELEDSCYSGEARRLLFVAWFMWSGLLNLTWLFKWSQVSQTRDGRLLLLCNLVSSKEKDSSLWYLICNSKFKEDDEFWQTLVDSSSDERIDSILEALQTDMKSYSIFAKCAAYYSLNSKASWPPFNSEPSETLKTSIARWKEGTLRKQRVYEIPYMCLFGMTWRGAGGDTTNDLRSLDLEQLLKSPWWKKTLQPFLGESGSWKSDEDLELFWDTYFPCDIPDEWSLKDQQKSHGPGITNAANATLTRWWRNWIHAENAFVEKHVCTAVQKWAESQPGSTGISLLDRIIHLYRVV